VKARKVVLAKRKVVVVAAPTTLTQPSVRVERLRDGGRVHSVTVSPGISAKRLRRASLLALEESAYLENECTEMKVREDAMRASRKAFPEAVAEVVLGK
jgi:hypothetical protein